MTVVWVADNRAWWQNSLDVGGLDVGVKEKLIPRLHLSN